MFKFCIILLIFLLRVVPIFLGKYMTIDGAFDMVYTSDLITISLLLWYVYFTLGWNQKYCKLLCLATLLVNLCILISYIFMDEVEMVSNYIIQWVDYVK